MVLSVNMHLNHWNDVLFYWYQSYHWYQWTIGLTNRIRLCILDMFAGARENEPALKSKSPQTFIQA